MKTIHPFNNKTALILSFVTGVIFTTIMALGNLYDERIGFHTEFHLWLNLAINFLLSYILFAFCFNIVKYDWDKPKKYIVSIAGTIVISIVFAAISLFFKTLIFPNPMNDDFNGIYLLTDGVIALTVLLITFFLYSLTERQRMLLENQKLQTENIRIRYENIEAQLDPHFLFNSLNTLNGLIGIDDESAHLYLQKLSSTYRYIIQNQNIVPFRNEISFTESYFYMMQIRYGKNLKMNINVDVKYLDYGVPAISLQLLVENALKHNVISDKYPLEISVYSTDMPSVIVSNPIHRKYEDSESSGIGLSNLSERYKLLCHKDITINDNEDVFSVEIPLLKLGIRN